MKVKTLLKTVTASKYEVWSDNITYKIDYLMIGWDVVKYSTVEEHPTQVTLPSELLDKKVKWIDSINGKLIIQTY